MAFNSNAGGSLPERFLQQLKSPLHLAFAKSTPAFLLGAFVIWGWAFSSSIKNIGKWRRREEYGSARLGTPNELNSKYKQDKNILISENVRLGIDTKKHGKACNVLVYGASGSRKTQGYVIPNIMELSTSYVIIDPSGESYRATGGLLEKNGYEIRVFDLNSMENTHRFNPFVYIQNEMDVRRLATSFAASTTDKTKMGGDQFWTDGMQQLNEALIGFLYETLPPGEGTFSKMTMLLKLAELKSDDMGAESDLDLIFKDYGESNPDSYAWGQYQMFKSAPPKTRASIISTLATRLGAFNMKKVADLTCEDELDIEKMGDRKSALFCIVPEGEQSFDFLVGMLYTTLFMVLYRKADNREDGFVGLDIPVHFIMDEWYNCGLPDSFDKKLATCRRRNIFISIIVQGLSQIKTRMDKAYEGILSNCPTLLYLGSNEQTTWDFISKSMGNETINAQTGGRSGNNMSTNQQILGRALMTPAEVRGLDDNLCIVLMQGENPVIDNKFDIMKHKRIKDTIRGGAKPYRKKILHIDREEYEAIQRSLINFEFLEPEINRSALDDEEQ